MEVLIAVGLHDFSFCVELLQWCTRKVSHDILASNRSIENFMIAHENVIEYI